MFDSKKKTRKSDTTAHKGRVTVDDDLLANLKLSPVKSRGNSYDTGNGNCDVSIRWSIPIPYIELDVWIDEYHELLYAVYKAGKRQFGPKFHIGQANSQDVINQIRKRQHMIHKVAEREGEANIDVIFGEIRLRESARISERLLDDIECLLIHAYEPIDNEKCSQDYRGRHLVIRNFGPGNIFDYIVDSRDYFD